MFAEMYCYSCILMEMQYPHRACTLYMQVHVGWLEGGTAVLAFRGTQTAQDGLQDVKIVRQSIDHLQGMFPGTQAHSGEIHMHCVLHPLFSMGEWKEGTMYQVRHTSQVLVLRVCWCVVVLIGFVMSLLLLSSHCYCCHQPAGPPVKSPPSRSVCLVLVCLVASHTKALQYTAEVQLSLL